MLKVMLQKIWHKKWMVICLLLGSILLTATAVSFPLYRNAAFDRMLRDEFDNYLSENSIWPGSNSAYLYASKNKDGLAMKSVEEFIKGSYDRLGTQEMETVLFYSLTKTRAHSGYDRGDEGNFDLRPGFLSNIEKHVEILSGEGFSETGMTEDGEYEALISESVMVKENLLLGETVIFDGITDDNGNQMKMKIVGVYADPGRSDYYWHFMPESMDSLCLIKEQQFKDYFTGARAENYTISCYYYAFFDYSRLPSRNVNHLKKATTELIEDSGKSGAMMALSDVPYMEVLENYLAKETRIKATLFLLQIPVLILLGAFLMMISGQMYDMERNEISVLKSRGASGRQIFMLYLYQSTFLSLIGTVIGLPFATLFCKMLGSADNFLQFNFGRELSIRFTAEAFLYLAVAFFGSILIMTIPAIPHSRVTIVKLKQQKAAKKHSLWEKCFLDVILLAISLYGFYNYSSNSSNVTEQVLKGQSLDPLLYLSSSLFILGAGLLVLRIQPLIVRLIYQIGKRWWKPAAYSSFMEIIKNGRKQQFIMLFMILTISLGMFDATVARTILQNARTNQKYEDGADLIVQEVWRNNSSQIMVGDNTAVQWYEPDFGKYAELTGAESYTKVIFDSKATIRKSSKENFASTLLGIHTREFGENTDLDDSLLAQPYYQYLNDLAVVKDGVLLSSNAKTDLGYDIGDEITFLSKDKKVAIGRVIGFFDYWPGYQPTTTALNAEGEVQVTKNYWVIANISYLQSKWDVTPYQVWITTKKGENSDYFYKWIAEKKVSVVQYTDRTKDIDKINKDPLLQGTNGILTMSFIVTIILCAVGYLIYWIMSIRSREMIFGVLRACGLHKGEIFYMLMIEQIFSGIFSILAGIGIGHLSSKMFVPMLQNAYAGVDQVLPMKLITNTGDLVRLYGVTAAVMVVCLAVLTMLVFKLNITKALKLGEE